MSTLRIGLVLLGAASLTWSTAGAQERVSADESAEGGLAEVTVTAQRFTSTVQTTPVAITAITADALEERQVTNILTAAAEVPGIMITPAQGSSTSARIFMRGVGQNTGGINFDPGVGIYIDNVYQPRINGAFFDFFDIDRLEVLRGPQGTLYGRNTSGGAIKIQTRRPSLEWSGAAELSGGNFNARGVRAWVSGPIIPDKLAFSASGVLRQRDGFIYGLAYGRRLGEQDARAERVKLLYTPTEALEVELAVFAIQDYSEGGVPVPLQTLPGVDPGLSNGTFNRDFTVTEIYGPFGNNSLNNSGGALNVRYELSDTVELASITGYGNLRTFSAGGSTNFVTLAQQTARNQGLPVNQPTNAEGRTRTEFYTQEFNALYTSESFKGVLGLYYYKEEGTSRALAATSPTIDQDRNTEASAAFAQGTYSFGSGIGVTAGLRYTRETADFTQYYRLLLATPQNAKKTFTSTIPKIGVSWQATESLLTYASYTQGFKSGGFNPIPPNANTGVPNQIGAPTPYNPEESKSIEVGVKYMTPNRKFRINVAAYRAKYDGMQLPVFFPGTSTIYTSNATSGTVKGVEFEPTWQVLDSLQIYGNGAFTSGKYNSPWTCANQFGAFINCGDREIANLIPEKWQLGVRFSPTLPLPGEFRFNASANHHGRYFNNVANEGPLVQTVAATIYNAGIAWTSPDEMWDVALDVRNAADKHYSLAGLQLSNPTRPAVSAFPNSPREVILRVGVQF